MWFFVCGSDGRVQVLYVFQRLLPTQCPFPHACVRLITFKNIIIYFILFHSILPFHKTVWFSTYTHYFQISSSTKNSIKAYFLYIPELIPSLRYRDPKVVWESTPPPKQHSRNTHAASLKIPVMIFYCCNFGRREGYCYPLQFAQTSSLSERRSKQQWSNGHVWTDK